MSDRPDPKAPGKDEMQQLFGDMTSRAVSAESKSAARFELALTEEEIYADPKLSPAPEISEFPREVPEAARVPIPDSGPVAGSKAIPLEPVRPASSSGILLARRRQTPFEKIRSHPILWPSLGGVLSLTLGFFVAVLFSGWLLARDVKPAATRLAILEKTPIERRNTPEIESYKQRIRASRSSIATKTGGVWTLVFAAGLFAWTRIFR